MRAGEGLTTLSRLLPFLAFMSPASRHPSGLRLWLGVRTTHDRKRKSREGKKATGVEGWGAIIEASAMFSPAASRSAGDD